MARYSSRAASGSATPSSSCSSASYSNSAILRRDGSTRESDRQAAPRAAARAHRHGRPGLVLREHRGEGRGAPSRDEHVAARACRALLDHSVVDRPARARRPAPTDRHAAADRGGARLRARRRPQAALLAISAVLALPALPHGWPKTLQIGLTENPGKHAPVRLGFRYQYLAGGVNTGNGWSTWNPNGTFASMYVQDSWAHNEIPVLSYYMLLQSSPSLGGEAATDLGHLRDPHLMEKY